jgi:hypothetical protein
MAGRTAADIAAVTGLAPETVDKQSRDPRTQTLMQYLKEQHEKPRRKAFVKALGTIETHLEHEDPAVVRDARRDLLRIVEAGDPPLARLEVKNSRADGDFTVAELLSTMREVTHGS